MKWLARTVLKMCGWRFIGGIPKGMKKCVIIAGLHTSNWDFFYGLMAMVLLNTKIKYFIKKEAFTFPAKYFLKATGGIPVDRGSSSNLIDQMAEILKEADEFVLTITPEGTRKYRAEWKKGFYFIAQKAKVPILMGYLDYKKKEIFLGEIFIPSGDVEGDMKKIRDFYRKTTPKYPEKGLKHYISD